MERRPPAYLSPSRLSCYAWCPAEFHQRYIQKIEQLPSIERQFGISVHCGLEAHFRGEDYELAFLRDWRNSSLECRQAGLAIPQHLTSRGLEMLDQVRALNLDGEPEHRIVTVVADLPLPIFGFVDLWADGKIYDFKTSGFGWTQARADRELFQPALYSLAYAEELHTDLPEFEFVVLPRAGGPVQRFDATRSPADIARVLQRVREIHQAIENQVFGCTCGRHVESAA